MLDRKLLLALAVGGLFVITPAACTMGQSPSTPAPKVTDKEKGEKDDEAKPEKKEAKEKDEADEKDEKGEKDEKKESKEIEQAVKLEMVPAPVLDAVKKEVPGGTITEAELVAKHKKIMWTFDVKSGDIAYDVTITVDGKFHSKEVDDEADEKDEKDAKPAAPAAKP